MAEELDLCRKRLSEVGTDLNILTSQFKYFTWFQLQNKTPVMKYFYSFTVENERENTNHEHECYVSSIVFLRTCKANEAVLKEKNSALEQLDQSRDANRKQQLEAEARINELLTLLHQTRSVEIFMCDYSQLVGSRCFEVFSHEKPSLRTGKSDLFRIRTFVRSRI